MIDLSLYTEYKELKRHIAEYSYDITTSRELLYEPIFIAKRNKVDLFHVFLINLPEDDREFYNTEEFKRFFDKYASLSYVNSRGKIKSIIWNEKGYNGKYKKAIISCRKMVQYSKIKNAYEYDDSVILYYDLIQTSKLGNNDFYALLDIDNVRVLPKNPNHTEEWFRNLTKI